MGGEPFPLTVLVLVAVQGEFKRDIERWVNFPGLVVENNVWAYGLACSAREWKFTQKMIPIQPTYNLEYS